MPFKCRILWSLTIKTTAPAGKFWSEQSQSKSKPVRKFRPVRCFLLLKKPAANTSPAKIFYSNRRLLVIYENIYCTWFKFE